MDFDIRMGAFAVLDLSNFGNGSVDAEFLDTIQLTSIQVLDANQSPVPGATITADNGVNCPLPEPAPAGVALLGSLGLLTRRKSAKPRCFGRTFRYT